MFELCVNVFSGCERPKFFFKFPLRAELSTVLQTDSWCVHLVSQMCLSFNNQLTKKYPVSIYLE